MIEGMTRQGSKIHKDNIKIRNEKKHRREEKKMNGMVHKGMRMNLNE